MNLRLGSAACLLFLPLLIAVPPAAGDQVCGSVRSGSGDPLAGAIVRIKGTDQISRTATDGTFCLPVPAHRRVRITAWSDGFYTDGTGATAGTRLTLTLRPVPKADHTRYQWMNARTERGPIRDALVATTLTVLSRLRLDGAFKAAAGRLSAGCRDCHRTCYDEWASSGHARGVRNPRFMSMYLGTHADGRVGQQTRRAFSRDYGLRPLAPDPARLHFGPGYKLDFPNTAGNCATCHMPGAAIDAPFETDPVRVAGIDREGIHCDFCHKIAAVDLDEQNGRPRPGNPGVLSMVFTRPGPGTQIFRGPFDDVDAGVDTFLPLMKQSEICGVCHDASFWGTPVYESFGEWKASGYARRGRTCQACHMRPTNRIRNFAPARGGVDRDPQTLAAHDFLAAGDAQFMRSAVRLAVDASFQSPGVLSLRATVSNAGAGHHIPTDSPLRHLILIVRASQAGRELPLQEGPTIPAWCGVGDPAAGNYSGLPGKAFAKVLEEKWTGVSPTAAYWNPTRIVSDNRIPAEGNDRSTYRFGAVEAAAIDIRIDLIYRQAFKELIAQKGWDAPDLLLASYRATVNPIDNGSTALRAAGEQLTCIQSEH